MHAWYQHNLLLFLRESTVTNYQYLFLSIALYTARLLTRDDTARRRVRMVKIAKQSITNYANYKLLNALQKLYTHLMKCCLILLLTLVHPMFNYTSHHWHLLQSWVLREQTVNLSQGYPIS